MSKSIIEQAELISGALTQHKQIDKAVNDLRAMQQGRMSRTLAYLELDHHTLSRAVNSAEQDSDETYTKLTFLVNEGTR